MINDVQVVASLGGFVEALGEGVDTLNIAATPADVLVPSKVFPHMQRTIVSADGWIDVRSFSSLTILSWALTQNSNILIQSRKSSIDPTSPEAVLVATALLTAGAAPTASYEGTTANITHIRILHSAASALGGTTNVSVFMR